MNKWGLNMETDYKKDCCITNDRNWFRYRAAAIIIEDDCILMASNDASHYYYSVGGGVHLGETAFAEKLINMPHQIEHILTKEI